MRRAAVAAVVAVLGSLAFAAQATAKEPKAAGVCGPSLCLGVTDLRQVALLGEASGAVSGSPAPVAPFYTIQVTIVADRQEESWEMYYVPSAGLVRSENEHGEARWAELSSPAARKLLDELTAQVSPFPDPTLIGVAVDGKAVSGDASTYLRLLALPADGGYRQPLTDWVAVDLRSEKPSPWTDGRWDLAYSRSGDALQRGTEVLSLPGGTSDDIAQAQALVDEEDGLSWTTIALVLAVIAALAAVFVPLAKRRPLPDPGPPPASEP